MIAEKASLAQKPKASKTRKGLSKQPRKKLQKKQLWGVLFKILLLLIWVAATVIVSQLIVGHAMLWILGRETFMQTVPMAAYSALSYILALAWLIFATPKLVIKLKAMNKQKGNKVHANEKLAPEKVDREDLGLRELPTWTDIGLAPVGFIVSTLLAAGLTAIFSAFPWFDAEQVQDVGFGTYLVGLDRVIAFIILVVVAPIAEEVIFRGWLYGKIRQLLSGKMSEMLAIIISIFLVSLLFGIIHMQWNVGVNVFALSVVLCGMREITGTIYAGILTHMLKNGIAFFWLYVLGLG